MKKSEKSDGFIPDFTQTGKKYIYVAYITRNGRRVYPSEYGLKAFRILVDA